MHRVDRSVSDGLNLEETAVAHGLSGGAGDVTAVGAAPGSAGEEEGEGEEGEGVVEEAGVSVASTDGSVGVAAGEAEEDEPVGEEEETEEGPGEVGEGEFA